MRSRAEPAGTVGGRDCGDEDTAGAEGGRNGQSTALAAEDDGDDWTGRRRRD